ncbi:MAG: class I SAM-dependent RNA methyltransferase [Acidobacteriota bacterium]
MIRRVTIETLAPTGEGVARTPEGVGFVAGALPGEDVDAEVAEVRKRFWKGRAVAIRSPSPDRISGGHAEGCAGCDWAHLDPARAREWKRRLFLETMARIGELPPEPFGELPIAASPPGYRIRNRFHVSGRGASASVGFFAPRTHRVEPAQGCEALSEPMRALLPRIADAVCASDAPVAEIATIETLDGSRRLARAALAADADRRDANALLPALAPLFDGAAVADQSGAVLGRSGESRLWLAVGGREFPVAAGTFFQANRFLVEELYRDIAREAASLSPGRALDAFGGVGLFAGALLDAGHTVTTVEADHSAAELALETKKRWGAGDWTIVRSAVLPFLARAGGYFDLAVVDPPRAGLGLDLAAAVPARIAGRLLYVSCDTATLARDLAVLCAEGLEIRGARLYDLFAFTHRVEAIVTLERAAAA